MKYYVVTDVHGWIPCESIRQNPYAVTYFAIDNWRNANDKQWGFALWINVWMRRTTA